MTTIHDIQDFLALHRIAMVGVSRNAKDFSRALFRELCKQGYDMVPINLLAAEIEGRECFRSLPAIKEPVEGVVVMTPSTEARRVVGDCATAGIRNVWFYRAGGEGAGSDEAIQFCRQNNIRVVEGHCPFMFLPRASFPHRFHGFLLKITGGYPAKAG
jgi:uncharacterized protein